MKMNFNINRKKFHYQRQRFIERNYYQYRFLDNSIFIKKIVINIDSSIKDVVYTNYDKNANFDENSENR